MAKVEILVDTQKLSRKPVDVDFQMAMGTHDLLQIRDRIRNHLRKLESPVLRVRLDEVRFQRLADLDGMSDLTVVRVTPRSELAAAIGEQVPQWCDSATIAQLGLLDTAIPKQGDWPRRPCDMKLLWLLDPHLISQEIGPEELLFLLFRTGKKVSPLCASEPIVKHFTTILSEKLGPLSVTRIIECLMSDNYRAQLTSLFRQVFQDKIKIFTTAHGLPWTFDARHFPSELTDKLALTDDWWQAISPDAELAALTDRVLLKINKGAISPECLPDIVWNYSTLQLEKIAGAVQQNPKLATQELLSRIGALDRVETADLERLIASLLVVESPGLLPPESTAKQAMDWAVRYLAHARSAFRREEEPYVEVSGSFSDWVDAQSQRIALSDYNWRVVASSVKEGLARNSDVILLVIDAFGAIVSDRLVQRLQGAIDWEVTSRPLFGPLPTLTEVAKLAVSSGLDVFQLPSDKVQALKAAYKGVLPNDQEVQFSQSWKEVDVTMDDKARLMVVFENQFDEQVHQCITHADLDAQLEVVCTKVVNSIGRWIKESQVRDRALEIFITSDHGMARIVTAIDAPEHQLTKSIKERCIEVDLPMTQTPSDYYLVTPEGHAKSKYLIPRDRVKFSKGVERFVHGGLSPEEILIPLIAIRRTQASQVPEVRISPVAGGLQTYGDGWAFVFQVAAGSTRVRRVQISCNAPFTGSCMVEHIGENQSKLVTMPIHSTVLQEGSVNIVLKVAFVLIGGDGFQEYNQSISIDLRPHMLIREAGAADFDNMFD